MSDFLDWDQDIDLDLLLGDYTEYDPDPSDSDDDTCSKAKKKKTNSASSDKPCYQCPVCQKLLHTIAGFRGHAQKQHGQNLRASDYRTDLLKRSDLNIPTNDSSFPEIFSAALQTSLLNISSDPFVIDDSISNICKFVSDSSEVQNILLQHFEPLFSETFNNITTSSDREQLFRRLHTSRLDHKLAAILSTHCTSFSKNSLNLFIQMLFEDIVGEIFSEQTKCAQQKSATEQAHISQNDQSILYYIAGFTIRALQSRYTRYSTKKLSVVKEFADNSKCVNFVKQFDKWYKTQDRGGLQKPCDTFFLLIRELETIVRKSIPKSTYCADSFLLGPLKELILESFMVKHYCNILMPDQTCDIAKNKDFTIQILVFSKKIHRKSK